jgi:hypothetical protein
MSLCSSNHWEQGVSDTGREFSRLGSSSVACAARCMDYSAHPLFLVIIYTYTLAEGTSGPRSVNRMDVSSENIINMNTM